MPKWGYINVIKVCFKKSWIYALLEFCKKNGIDIINEINRWSKRDIKEYFQLLNKYV